MVRGGGAIGRVWDVVRGNVFDINLRAIEDAGVAIDGDVSVSASQYDRCFSLTC